MLGSLSHPPAVLDLVAVCLAENGRFKEAEAVLNEALSKSKDRKEPWVAELELHLRQIEQGVPFRNRKGTSSLGVTSAVSAF